ncbi:MAG: MauE/DoxX family redox-associated membrane protein [Pyrinomonadaceae bacterium]
MEIVFLTIRLVLFAVFAISAITKFLDRPGTEKAVREFGVPEKLAKPITFLLPAAELAIAVSLLFVASFRVGAVAGTALLVAFIAAMAWQIRQGRAPDCHCFGQLHSEPVGPTSVIRNVILAVAAGALVFAGTGGSGADLFANGIGALPTILLLFLLVLAIVLVGYLAKLITQQNDLARRLDLLELTAGPGGPVERNEAGDPSDGLPIGAPLPDFAIPDLEGRIIQFEHLIGEDKPFLFLFVGAECAPCEQLIPEVREWIEELGDRVKPVIVSHGDIAVNRRKFGELGPPVLVESKREFANSVNAKWTPSALFVDRDGNIASHLAAGDVAIRRLIEQMKLRDLNERFVYFLGMTGQKRPDIGREIPDFQTADNSGKEFSRADLIGRKTLAAFISTTCGHCSRLISEIREWEARGGDNGLQMLVFSDGSQVDGEAIELNARLIVDRDHKLAAKFGMRGVPSAVLIDDQGVIVTEAAIGPENIWSLLGIKPE